MSITRSHRVDFFASGTLKEEIAQCGRPGADGRSVVICSPALAKKVWQVSSAGGENEEVVKVADLAAIYYSSGTTGPSKAVAHTHATLVKASLPVYR